MMMRWEKNMWCLVEHILILVENNEDLLGKNVK